MKVPLSVEQSNKLTTGICRCPRLMVTCSLAFIGPVRHVEIPTYRRNRGGAWRGCEQQPRFVGMVRIRNAISLKLLATPPGFEPGTFSLEGCCSIHLSYGAAKANIINGLRLALAKIKPHLFTLCNEKGIVQTT